MIRVILILCFFYLSFSGWGQVSPYELPPIESHMDLGSIYGTSALVTTLTDVQDYWPQSNPAWQNGYTVSNARCRVALKIITEENIATYDFTAKIPVELQVYRADYSIDTYQQIFEVNYDPASGSSYKQVDLREFKEAYRVEISVDPSQIDITSSDAGLVPLEVADALELTCSTVYDRIDEFDPSYYHTMNNLSSVENVNDRTLNIFWKTIPGAVHYELEWTFKEIYDFSTYQLYYLNFNNCPRVKLTAREYTLPIIYESGLLSYRVRGIAYEDGNLSKPIYGAWSCGSPNGNCNSSNTVSSWLNQHMFTLYATPHEQDRLNWQIVTSYAEEGKRKDVITYMDGTMRSRQTATVINSDENVLVAETFYDHQGRPAVQALPAPVHQNMNLKFRQNFNNNNINSNYKPYSKLDFDLDPINCGEDDVGKMNNFSGAAHYYSSGFYNQLTQDEKDNQPHLAYLPSADGYPFVHTQYTADNTGRIARQGGAGPQYQLGSTHETKYFYSVPLQEELNLLFGTNVGFADHYKKNMVVDPNGQVSISYLDAKGNTIATALAGEAPYNLEQLESYRPRRLLADLIKYNRRLTRDNQLKLVYNLNVEDKASYYFNYEMEAQQFLDTCVNYITCYDCYYDLNITVINNQCGEVIFEYEKALREYEAMPDSIDNICSTGFGFKTDTLAEPFELRELEIGTYSVIKTLSVNEDIADAYVEHYLNDAQNECTNVLEEYLLEEMALIDTSDCSVACDDLAADDMTAEDLQDDYSWVNMLCDTVASNPCEVARRQMMADFMPGGQYAQFEYDPDNDTYISSDPLSIFNPNNILPDQNVQIYYGVVGMYYQNVTYLSEDNIEIDGVVKSPHSLNIKEYIDNYKDSWAERFVDHHPERCYLDRCDQIVNSHTFDIDIGNIDDYQTAFDEGWIDISGDPLLIFNADPYSDPNRTDHSYLTSLSPLNMLSVFQGKLTNYQPPYNYSILDLSIYTVMCVPNDDDVSYLLEQNDPFSSLPPPNIIMTDCLSSFGGLNNITDEQRDQIWQTYRSLYMSTKNDVEYIIRTIYAISNNCYNECIGQENFNPFINDFFDGTPNSYFFDLEQTCSFMSFPSYADKQKRFPSVYDLLPNMDVDYYDPDTEITTVWENIIDNTDSELLSNCKECPELVELDSLLTAVFQTLQSIGAVNPNSIYEHEDEILIPSYSPRYFDFEYVEYHNPTDADTEAGIRIYINDNCSFEFNIPLSYQQIEIPVCNQDHITNGDFELIIENSDDTPDEDIGRAVGWSGTYDPTFYSTGDLFTRAGLGNPDPNNTYAGMWNTCYSAGSAFTESIKNQLEEPVLTNSGIYTLQFDLGCGSLSQKPGMSIDNPVNPTMEIYGIYNLSNTLTQPFTDNLQMFGANNMIFLESIQLTDQYMNEWSNYTIEIDTDSNNFPASGITHIVFVPAREETSTRRFVYFDNLSLCKSEFEYASEHVVPDDLSIKDLRFEGDNLVIDLEYSQGEVVTITEPYSCPISCEDDSGKENLICHPLPEANDLLRLVNAFNWNETGQSGQGSITTSSQNVGTAISEAIDLDLSGESYELLTQINHDSIIFQLKEDCTITLLLGRAASQFGVNDIIHFTKIEPFFGSHINDEGYTNYFRLTYRKANGSSGSVYGYTSGCFYVGYCCPLDDIVDDDQDDPKPGPTGAGPNPNGPSDPSGPSGPPGSGPLGAKGPVIAKPPGFFAKLFGRKKMKKNEPILAQPILPLFSTEGQIIAGKPIPTTTSVDTIPYWDPLCDSCDELEITGGIFGDLDYGNNCEDIFCRDSFPILYQTDFTSDCIDLLYDVAEANAYIRYEQYIDSIARDLKYRYLAQCLNAEESFTGDFAFSQHHFTLYYYDQANNLVQTVPPNGIDTLTGNIQADTILLNAYRKAQAQHKADTNKWFYLDGNSPEPSTPVVSRILPSWASEYSYNSLNQLTEQKIPDQGYDYGNGFVKEPTVFWYDDLGRLVASQNPKQAQDKKYSYTLYDGLGRIRETGEVIAGQDPDQGLGQPISTGYYDNGNIVDADPSSYWPNFLSGPRAQITETSYDYGYYGASQPPTFPEINLENLRGRVSAAAYYDTKADMDQRRPNFITHYAYDIHGNVESLLQKPKGFAYKSIEYDYDLISGNVNYVWYQRDKFDQFTHRYDYDADNRLTKVRTSRDGIIWDRDAKYIYYPHGPLARLELGEEEVQGLDYAYTLQGWIKGMNSASSMTQNDIGQDGVNNHLHQNFARDEVGYILNYNKQDYRAIGNFYEVFDSDFNNNNKSPELWNGNIRSMITAIRAFMPDGKPSAYSYHYDQLNRIKSMTHHDDFDEDNTWASYNPSNKYSSSYAYDANGNITELSRRGVNNGTAMDMDAFTYNYTAGNNRLNHVDDDTVLSENFDNDLDEQDPDNYLYDRLGNLTRDVKDSITNISWNLSGKVSQIEKLDGTKIKFLYDALGNRIAKQVDSKLTYYIRDAMGNTMAHYKTRFSSISGFSVAPPVYLESVPIYGSARLGMYMPNKLIGGAAYTQSLTSSYSSTIDIPYVYEFSRGESQYELSNHLESVIATVSDRKSFEENNVHEKSYVADLRNATDYYPGGSSLAIEGNYVHGYNGQELDMAWDNNHYTSSHWEYDSRLLRRFNIDPKPTTYLSTYSTFRNNPILFQDVLGDTVLVSRKFAKSREFRKLKKDWRKQAGLAITVKNGQLEYAHTMFKGIKKPARTPDKYSSIARDQLINAMDGSKTATLVSRGYTGYDPNDNTISFDATEIEELMYNVSLKKSEGVKSNLTEQTIGYGLASYHEFDHWLNGTTDETSKESPAGITVQFVNMIRDQLSDIGSEDFGNRTTYFNIEDRDEDSYLGVLEFEDSSGQGHESFRVYGKIKSNWFNRIFRKNALKEERGAVNGAGHSHGGHDH